ncbi:hypothetical protein [Streptomyces lancefieldiae]|uniref:Uncharacterized protein n=1 Tax=Streptomyces lancefieldiae TaxID=3075520 RepID=A0ABU3B1Y9_9ACTN|nr:hypothetical protein [Streptomyces sp. DSM 40712]MDT0616462.1 hypothetical protein [Streptomyces sp. DSM 40712]
MAAKKTVRHPQDVPGARRLGLPLQLHKIFKRVCHPGFLRRRLAPARHLPVTDATAGGEQLRDAFPGGTRASDVRAGANGRAGEEELRPHPDDRTMTDRRPLGTGPDRTAASRAQDTAPAPRAPLAAERLPAAPATTEPKPARPPAGRRILGAGPDAQAVTSPTPSH